MNTSVIIPVFNQLSYTKICIESIKKNNSDIAYEIIVINNGSTDGTEEYLKQAGIVYINNKENLGAAKAWNQGIKQSKGDYLFIINNDIIVCKDWIKNLINIYNSEKNIGILSPATREGELNYDFDEYSKKFIDKMKTIRQEGFFGWCIVIKKDRFEKTGLFCEEFETGIGEDTDFFIRLKKYGYKNYITGATFVHHFGSRTLNDVKRLKGDIFEQNNIKKLREKWHIKGEPYFCRKTKSLIKFIKNMWLKIFYGYILFEKK